MKNKRPSWDEYFMGIALSVSQRGTCDRGRAGTIIVKDKHILSTGYVGAPKGFEHCDEAGHLIKKITHEDGSVSQHCLRTVHSEQNAICQAAKNGVSINDSTLYTVMTPCRSCAMMIVNSGINRVVCLKKYHVSKETELVFKKAGVKIDYLTDELMVYDKM